MRDLRLLSLLAGKFIFPTKISQVFRPLVYVVLLKNFQNNLNCAFTTDVREVMRFIIYVTEVLKQTLVPEPLQPRYYRSF